MAAGSVLFATGTENVYDLKGTPDKQPLYKVLPIPLIAAVCGALAISGSPLFNGFVSKYILKYAFADIQPAGFLLLLASVGTATSFCKFLYFGFFKARVDVRRRPYLSMNIAMIAVSLATIILGVRAELIEVLVPHSSSLPYYSLSNIWGGLQFILYGIVVFIILRRFLDPANKPALFKKLSFVDPFFDWVGSATYVLATIANSFDKMLNIVYEDGSSSLKRVLSFEFLKVSKERAAELVLQFRESTGQTVAGDEGTEDVKVPEDGFKTYDLKGWNIKNLNISAMIMAFLLATFLIIFFSYSRYFA